MKAENIWWEEHSQSFTNTCVECSDVGVIMSDRMLTEMIQKNLITPQDLARVNDPTYPEDKRQLIMSLISK